MTAPTKSAIPLLRPFASSIPGRRDDPYHHQGSSGSRNDETLGLLRKSTQHRQYGSLLFPPPRTKTGQDRFAVAAEQLAAHLSGFQATDPRDKVYALLLCSVDGDQYVQVNYSLPVEEVYIQVATSFIRKDLNLDILGHCNESPEWRSLLSWVPNWNMSTHPVV